MMMMMMKMTRFILKFVIISLSSLSEQLLDRGFNPVISDMIFDSLSSSI